MPKYPARTYEDIEKKKVEKNKLDFDSFRNKLKLKHFEVTQSFAKKYPHVSKFISKKGISLGKIREHSAKVLGVGALAGSLMVSPIGRISESTSVSELVDKLKLLGDVTGGEGLQKLLLDNLTLFLPEKVRPLEPNEEKFLERLFSQIVKIETKANLEGEHLNTTFGYIGAEQHLKRYPGDSLQNHGTGEVIKEGMAPGLGAWGYFATTRNSLTPNLENIEKWYGVVQTLYLPDWNIRQPYLRDWYRYRKILIVNTNNGNAVVAAIADSGPAAWTGKQFGGSPEVMEYLGGKNYKKGPVLVFFVNDPENKVPLGPVEYNKISLPEEALVKA